MARGQGSPSVVLLGVADGAAALVGSPRCARCGRSSRREEDRTVMVGQRTRAALEREKLLTLRSIKELEFDRAMGRCPTRTGRRCPAACARARAADAAARCRRRLPRADRAGSREAVAAHASADGFERAGFATPARPTRSSVATSHVCAALRDRQRRRRAVLQGMRAASCGS